jgi:hypothetical protein
MKRIRKYENEKSRQLAKRSPPEAVIAGLWVDLKGWKEPAIP